MTRLYLKTLTILLLLLAASASLFLVNQGFFRREWYPSPQILKEIERDEAARELKCPQSPDELKLSIEYQKLSLLEHKNSGDANLPELKDAVGRYAALAGDFNREKGLECYIAAGIREKKKFTSIFYDFVRMFREDGSDFDEFLQKNRTHENFVQIVSRSGVFIYEAERTGLLYEKPIEAAFIAGILFKYRWISWIKEIEKPEILLHESEYTSLLKWKLLSNRDLSDERRLEIKKILEKYSEVSRNP